MKGTKILRQPLHLQAGEQLEFDETAPILTARRLIDRAEWEATMTAMGTWLRPMSTPSPQWCDSLKPSWKPQAVGTSAASIAALDRGRRFRNTCRCSEEARLRGRALGGELEFFQQSEGLSAVIRWTQANGE